MASQRFSQVAFHQSKRDLEEEQDDPNEVKVIAEENEGQSVACFLLLTPRLTLLPPLLGEEEQQERLVVGRDDADGYHQHETEKLHLQKQKPAGGGGVSAVCTIMKMIGVGWVGGKSIDLS